MENEAQRLWKIKRLARATSSEFSNIIGLDKKGNFPSVAGETYLNTVLAELMTAQEVTDSRPTFMATEWGLENEPLAFDSFKEYLGQEGWEYFGTYAPKFFTYGKWCGGSPDSHNAMLRAVAEFKCPMNSAIHLQHLSFDTVEKFKAKKPDAYWQLLGNAVITGSATCHFVSFDKRYIHKNLQLHVLSFELPKEDAELVFTRLNQCVEWLESKAQILLERAVN